MNRKEVHLYRVKLIRPSQMPLLSAEHSPRDIMLSAIAEKPTHLIANGTGWSIGNVNQFDSESGYFAIGRITQKSVERFDRETGDFKDEMDETGPYTLAFFDASIGLLGIQKKTNVSASPASISRRIKELFEKTSVVIETAVNVRIDYIPDPENFITKLRTAYSIQKFWATFTGPNPTDADEIFQKPLSVYCDKLGANRGTIEVVGNDIDAEAAEAVARSTAATANTASATVIENYGSKSRRIKMKKGAAVIQVDPEHNREQILNDVRMEYLRVKSD